MFHCRFTSQLGADGDHAVVVLNSVKAFDISPLIFCIIDHPPNIASFYVFYFLQVRNSSFEKHFFYWKLERVILKVTKKLLPKDPFYLLLQCILDLGFCRRGK